LILPATCDSLSAPSCPAELLFGAKMHSEGSSNAPQKQVRRKRVGPRAVLACSNCKERKLRVSPNQVSNRPRKLIPKRDQSEMPLGVTTMTASGKSDFVLSRDCICFQSPVTWREVWDCGANQYASAMIRYQPAGTANDSTSVSRTLCAPRSDSI
jgi:hypothetical protein